MKPIISRVLITMALLFCLATVLPVCALEAVDPMEDASLTVTYQYENTRFAGLIIDTYRIAQVDEQFTFALDGAFASYPVRLYGIQSQAEWRIIAKTLESYIVADRISPSATEMTDENGVVCFSGLRPGIYLTRAVTSEKEGVITRFETFLTVIPRPNAGGGFEYDVSAYPKCEQITPDDEEIPYKVVKQWRDGGYTDTRTEQVAIEVYRDGVLFDAVILSDENQWMHTWTGKNDGSVFTVVERDVPADYHVMVTKEQTTFLVTNVYDDPDMPPPQTGDSIGSYFYVVLFSVLGCALLLLSFARKKEQS